jgi:hypothetical protein
MSYEDPPAPELSEFAAVWARRPKSSVVRAMSRPLNYWGGETRGVAFELNPPIRIWVGFSSTSRIRAALP